MLKTNVYVLVFFQENNAIAVVDMQAENISAIYGLGFKDWIQATKMEVRKIKCCPCISWRWSVFKKKVIQETFRGYPCLRYPLLCKMRFFGSACQKKCPKSHQVIKIPPYSKAWEEKIVFIDIPCENARFRYYFWKSTPYRLVSPVYLSQNRARARVCSYSYLIWMISSRGLPWKRSRF